MGGGGPAPGSRPQNGLQPWSLFDTRSKLEGTAETPDSGPFHAAYPPFLDLQNLQKPAVNHLSRSSYADTPPYERGVNNHLSRSSYGEDPPMGGGVTPIG